MNCLKANSQFQVRSGKVKKRKIGKGQDKTGQVRTCQWETGGVRTAQLRNVTSGQVRTYVYACLLTYLNGGMLT